MKKPAQMIKENRSAQKKIIKIKMQRRKKRRKIRKKRKIKSRIKSYKIQKKIAMERRINKNKKMKKKKNGINFVNHQKILIKNIKNKQKINNCRDKKNKYKKQ